MKTIEKITAIISDILDVEPGSITPQTYLVRDLDAESIDLLELALALGAGFDLQVKDDDLFLKDLRLIAQEAVRNGQDPWACIRERLPHIPGERAREMIRDLDGGPVLKVADLVSYIDWLRGSRHA